MTDDNNTIKDPEPEALRVQLSELNNRSRWYSAELWQIPFVYLGLTGLTIVQVADKTPKHLGLSFITAAVFGVFVIIHMFKIRKHETRAVEHLKKTETALHLPPTAKSSSGPTIFQVAVFLAVIAFAFIGIYLFFNERCDKSTIQQKTTTGMNNTNEKLSLPKDNVLRSK
ncbi:MAG: hypothetical protein HZA10_09670 [Nitrospirae bacterium]|nr:hypothetical protein [Nitrospirota bacterium]